MFNIFKKFSNKPTKLKDKVFYIEYNSYDFLQIIINKIKPYINKYSTEEITFNSASYYSDMKYDNFFDTPYRNSSIIINKNLSMDKYDELANSIINIWQYDDSADIVAEDICNSCKNNNCYNVSVSFVFTNCCPNFKEPGLIIYWKTN